ncbi:hypothetical protein ABEX69_09270 [Bacillus safensis]|uniref:hypothetical protein n=1 Tax=Bacillus safensis TaxID=561879 RepID=UPI0022816570|nr:hypothetical protein [Bacillus safensis]MCY7565749.1 hypothetical protein [Bacillus safensis]MCY7626349.1 hypothetical protein [Bacillus safensis]MCY7634614.1 hypothetical protein [Bacillus safensis]MCY7649407.1 hypothetical protein [Bacillus safensis]MCY7650924.1 hypothetical protein [Bacillus safensis]
MGNNQKIGPHLEKADLCFSPDSSIFHTYPMIEQISASLYDFPLLVLCLPPISTDLRLLT